MKSSEKERYSSNDRNRSSSHDTKNSYCHKRGESSDENCYQLENKKARKNEA